MVAAPLLDSSSGCACTAIRRSFSAMVPSSSYPPCPPSPPGAQGYSTQASQDIVPKGSDSPRRGGGVVTQRELPVGRYGSREKRRRPRWVYWSLLSAFVAAGLVVAYVAYV